MNQKEETSEKEELRPLTEEEIKKLRDQMQKSYEDELPMLRLQREYEFILADIEEARFKRMAFVIKQAEMASRTQEPQTGDTGTDDGESKPGEKKRVLRTQERGDSK